MKIRSKMMAFYGALIIFGFIGISSVFFVSYGMSSDLWRINNDATELVFQWNNFTNRTKDFILRNIYSHISNLLDRLLNDWKVAYNNFKQNIQSIKDRSHLFGSNEKLLKTMNSTFALWKLLQVKIFDIEKRINRLNDEVLPKVDISGNLLYILFTINKELELKNNNRYAEYAKFLYETKDQIIKLSLADDSFYKLLQRLASEIDLEVLTLENTIQITIIIGTGIILVVSLIVAFIFSNLVTLRIKKVERAISAVSLGDFSVKIKINTNDEFGILSKSFDFFMQDLRHNINSILDFMKNVGAGISEEINMKSTLKQIVLSVSKGTYADGVAILCLDDNEKHFKIEAKTGNFTNPYFLEDELNPKLLVMDNAFDDINIYETLAGKVFLSGESIFIKRTKQNDIWDPSKNWNLVSSFILCPIIVENKIFGVLAITRQKKDSPFTDLDFTHARSFAEYSGLTLDNMNKYIVQQEKNQLDHEMQVAKKIQTALLPENISNEEFDISAIMIPAEEVGGDYYDFCFDRDNNLWIGVGDVSGHGVTAGLIMMMAQTAHYQFLKFNSETTPKDVIVSINDVLYRNISGRLNEMNFMTFTTLKYNGDGHFLYAGAHLDILIHRKASNTIDTYETDGVFLNLVGEIEAHVHDFDFYMDHGDTMLLYTDGIIECVNDFQELLDMNGLKKIFHRHVSKTSEDLKNAIMHDVFHYCKYKYNDDLTVIVVRRK